MGIRKRGKEIEVEILLEEIGIQFYPVDFPQLVKLIPKVEKSIRVAVYVDNGKYYPSTKTGSLLANAYVQLGFSFVPILIVEREEKE